MAIIAVCSLQFSYRLSTQLLNVSLFQEREAAARMFGGKKGEKLVNGAMKSKTNK